MVRKEENVLITRKFGNTSIHWQISQFCFENIREGFLISGPEFCVEGQYITKWKMTLNPKNKRNEEYHFSVSLERLKFDPGPDSASVSLKVWLTDYKDEKCSIFRYSSNFKNNHPHEITLESVNYIREKLKLTPNASGTFFIFCHLIINFEDCYESIDEPIDTGLKSLSEDLINLYKVGTDYDIILRINGKDIYAHKAVLCPRSHVLVNIVKNQPKDMIVDLPDLDYEAVKNVVAYIYSGNIDYIARNASIMMQEATLFFKLDYVGQYFNPHNLYIRSEIDAKSHSFFWVIKNWTEITGYCILSPLFFIDYMDTTWRLRLYPKGIDRTDKHLSVVADVVEGTMPDNCTFRFTVMDDNGSIWSDKIQLLSDSNERIGFENFISKKHFQSKLEQTAGDTFHVVFRLDISPDSVSSSDTYTMGYGAFPVDQFYWCLSRQLTFSFELGDYADVTLEAERISFKASKCILSARSPVLKAMVTQVSGEESIVFNMKSNVLRTILHYIYSGIYGNFAENAILDIYKAANELSLFDLKEKCSRILVNCLCVESVCEVLTFSHEQNDFELKLSVLNFMCKNNSKIFEDKSWKSLEVENPLLCAEVLEFLKNE